MTRTVAIIQARYGSKRCPAKAIRWMWSVERPMLAQVIEQVKLIRGVDEIAVAVPRGQEELVGQIAKRRGVAVVAPACEENDLLSRYLLTAEAMRSDVVVRITSDCPELDPDICSEVIALRERTGAAYASNYFVSRKGTVAADCEVFTIKALRDAAANPWNEPEHREHVGPAIKFVLAWENIAVLKKGCDLSVDTEEDFVNSCSRLAAKKMREAA